MAHIRYAGPEAVLDALVDRYPILAPQKEDIRALYELIRQSFASGGKLLVCGNGGSAARRAAYRGRADEKLHSAPPHRCGGRPPP